ncbi:MAG: hypothetical protein KJ558_10460 [Gammaproteobacteria bacterium]|nr:hypothetical protein [Gammaproteobacteria bacterium]MBU1655229.1 hypothetical protein [Gammaproteobacteria bacterium]MBU1961342.1 hypothetical protein [Gammaproteobacteria bacterium]
MSWTRPGDLKAQLARLWERGELLRPLAGGETRFPLRLALKGPSSTELAERFEAVRGWIGELAAMPRICVEWREVRHRVQGAQRLPQSVWIDSLEDAIALIGRGADTARFARLLELTGTRQPALLEWLGRHPLQALGLADDWPRLLQVVAWMEAHPRPGIYLRQVDIAGIHSKFIEAHRGVLAELFDLVLPDGNIDAGRTGIQQFAARYGFLDKPARIRLRVLDERIGLLPGPALPDVTLDADSFARLEVPVRRLFITENETNFLAFPPVAGAIVVFGAGYGWDALARAAWLGRCPIHYWGDIDTHGFAILDQLRRRFDQVGSFLMDRSTLMAHEALWGEEPEQVVHDLPNLTAAESSLYDALRDNRIRANLRLEQEMVGYGFVRAALADLMG